MASGFFDDEGQVTINAAVELDVRWEEGRKETLDPKGNVIAIDATVVVDRDIVVGSIMWEGALADVASPPVDLYQVVTRSKVPNVKGRKFRRTVGLMRYSDSLPTIAS